MKNKKLAILAAMCLVTATAATVTACKPTPVKPTGPVYEVTVAATLDMVVNEVKHLAPTYTSVEGASLTFTSSNPAVATVDANGSVTALTAGTTTITVTYGTASETCEVTVTFGDSNPVLEMEGIPNEITIDPTTTLPLNHKVMFGGVEQTDATFEYVLSTDEVGSVVNGAFVPSASGTVELTVTGVWRNAEFNSLTKTIVINVVPKSNNIDTLP